MAPSIQIGKYQSQLTWCALYISKQVGVIVPRLFSCFTITATQLTQSEGDSLPHPAIWLIAYTGWAGCRDRAFVHRSLLRKCDPPITAGKRPTPTETGRPIGGDAHEVVVSRSLHEKARPRERTVCGYVDWEVASSVHAPRTLPAAAGRIKDRDVPGGMLALTKKTTPSDPSQACNHILAHAPSRAGHCQPLVSHKRLPTRHTSASAKHRNHSRMQRHPLRTFVHL